MRACLAFVVLAGCGTETQNPSGCPGHLPAESEHCDTTLSCNYYASAGSVGCSDTLPIFDCIDGGWVQRRIEATATCPPDVPMAQAVCPMDIPCNGNIRTLICNYGCVRAQCTQGSSWITRYTCDGGLDASKDAAGDE